MNTRNDLPSLRQKLLKSFSLLVALYAALGLILVVAVLMASRNTPKVIHLNYDSISAMTRMQESWNALRAPEEFNWRTPHEWRDQFERALQFEENNLTEPGEREIAQNIRSFWLANGHDIAGLPSSKALELRQLIESVIRANERGMFELAAENTDLARTVLFGAIIYFVISLSVVLFVANNLAGRISRPLNEIARALQDKPAVGSTLSLPAANSQEIQILTQELAKLWFRVSEIDKHNIDKLIQEKTKLQTVLESVEDALVVIDPDGKITHCNHNLLRLLGRSDEDLKGQSWRDIVLNNEEFKPALTITNNNECELKLGTPRRYYSVRLRHIVNASALVATLYLFHDVTERRQREKLRSDLIDLLSHELKTPLQSLGTASDLLAYRKDDLPEDLRVFAETISEDVDRIRGVANEFVQITQTKSKMMRLHLERVAINGVIEDWLKPFKIIAKDKGVKVELYSEGSDPILANVDRVKFPWVLSNLVSNAIRFSPKGAVVIVKVSGNTGQVEIRVEDQGPGVSQGERQRIFEPFYQSDDSIAQDGNRGLMGVGLTIAKEVVEAHDGCIEYLQNVPTGSILRITLPTPDTEVG